ncbi:selenocysteine insertion sequence-binding protein 2-like [Cephus cinctus]|uniref:Selenocysteine insertion sequence-binding protein 2-like n=1 Tax=Cephus cinctus TaxID=211228 RepID=A0AAJ7FMC5_CEPCN|nr:selenocysteine insertion sequence-binding protein 2-like [Cephus cinctus]
MYPHNHYRCSGNSAIVIELENHEEWPELSSERLLRKNSTPQTAPLCIPENTGSTSLVKYREDLNDEEYPKLGEKFIKRKYSLSINNGTDIIDVRLGNVGIEEASEIRKPWKKPRSSDLIYINLHKASENLSRFKSWETDKWAGKKMHTCHLNLDIRKSLKNSHFECNCRVVKDKLNQAHSRRGKTSKLKQTILFARELKTQMNIRKRELFELEKMQALTKDVSEIDFDKLKIDVGPKVDVDFLQSMSRMTLYGSNHRKPRIEPIAEQSLQCQNRITQRLEQLLIQTNRDEFVISKNNDTVSQKNFETISPDFIHKTLCLEICDETGETAQCYIQPEENYQLKYSKKFREYCTNILTQGLNESSEKFLAEIVRLQRKLYERDNIKGKCKRRYYAGIKETEKHIELKKVKFVMIAPDLEKVEIEGGLDESIYKLIGTCRKHDVPFCFALGKRKIGYHTHKKGCVSCIGVANYSGAEDKFKNVLEELVHAKNVYHKLSSKSDKMIDLGKLIPDNDLLISERINCLLRILGSSN